MKSLRQTHLIFLLASVLAMLLIVTVQAFQFHGRAYRQDEAWVVHYAIENIERVGLGNHILQIFQNVVPENVIQDLWVYAFGQAENIVRFFSTLYTLVTLAIFYRLASDLFDRQAGLIAMFMLGTLSIYAYFSHEARTYSALVFGTVGFQWALLWFIRRPKRLYAGLTLLFGVIPFYQHPFLLYVYAAQVICILVFVRWDRDRYLRGIALFVVLGLLVALRIYINFASRGGEILYATATSIDAILPLYNDFKFNPEMLGNFAFLSGLLIPITLMKANRPDPVFRFGDRWRKWWIVISLVVMLGLILLVNAISPNLTPRNLLVIAPYLALIAAYGIRHVPWQAQIVAVVIFFVPFAFQFRYHLSNAGYRELAQYMEEHYDAQNDRIMVIAPQMWEWIPIKYYLDERTNLGLSNSDMLYVSIQKGGRFVPQRPDASVMIEAEKASDFDQDAIAQIEAYLGERERLWVIKANPFPPGNRALAWVDDHFSIHTVATFAGEGYYRPLEIVEYRRQPADPQTVARFGEDIRLEAWAFNNDVEIQPCQTISLDTWWQIDEATTELYSTTLVIADTNGQGVVNADGFPGEVILTPQWEVDHLYFSERELTVPCDIPAGDYLLLLGMYDVGTITNLPVHTPDGEPMGTDLFYLTTLRVAG